MRSLLEQVLETAPPVIHFAMAGKGTPLILGYPLSVSQGVADPTCLAQQGYLGRLIDRYRVLVMDYPNLGRSEPIPAHELTAERVSADLLRVADAAGFERFIWWGYSWGGIIGLQLACRTDRLLALICGGWPPLGNFQLEVLRSCRAAARRFEHQKQYVTYYESLRNWPEAAALRRISCPKMTYVGSEDVVEREGLSMATAATLRAHRRELESEGWHVWELPGRDHSVWADPESVVPGVRHFLEDAFARTS